MESSRVSNPLGWDGDKRQSQSARKSEFVSNPLGWDGDGDGLYRHGKTFRQVSNPLGWDGDCRSAGRRSGVEKFLIH